MKNQLKLFLVALLSYVLFIGCSKETMPESEPDIFQECRVAIEGAYSIERADPTTKMIEGDIIPDMPSIKSTNKALVNVTKGRLWTNNTVPYFLDDDLEESKKVQIRERIQYLEDITYIDFIEFSNGAELLKEHTNGIHFRSPTNPFAGNSSYVGMQGGLQDLTLVYNSKDFVIEHEILHALGFEHEIKRADRDEHIIMLWDNLPPNPMYRRQFEIEADAILCGEYDIHSIMHYGSYHGGWYDAEETNRPVYTDMDGNIVEQPTKLSDKDIKALHTLYPEIK